MRNKEANRWATHLHPTLVSMAIDDFVESRSESPSAVASIRFPSWIFPFPQGPKRPR